MKTKLFYQLAKEAGIEHCELKIARSTSISVSTFNGKIDTYNIADEKSITARGIVNNKFGVGITNIEDKNTPKYLVDSILATGKYVEKEEDAIIFEGSKKYVKRNIYNEELPTISMDEKLKPLEKIYEYCKNKDPRIENIEAGYYESDNKSEVTNSYGLKLSNKTNNYEYVCFVTVRGEDGEVVNAFDEFFGTDLHMFDPIALAEKVTTEALSKLNPIQCPSKNYKVLLNQETSATLLKSFIHSLSSEEVQKHTSSLAGKLDQEIASKKITIMERPTDNTMFFRGYDSEGVATKNKTIVNKGVLKTYLYNLTTAKKDGVESTGNGYGGVTKIGIGTTHIVLKPGKKSFDELLAKVKNGIYITDIMGLHAGMNASSGEFSLQAQGFMIENGKLGKPLSQIVLAGNLFDLFKNVVEVGSDLKLLRSGTEISSLLVKSLQVSGK